MLDSNFWNDSVTANRLVGELKSIKNIIQYPTGRENESYTIPNTIQTINNFQFTPEIGVKVLGGIAFYILIAGHNKFKKKSLLVFFVLATITTLVYLYMV